MVMDMLPISRLNSLLLIDDLLVTILAMSSIPAVVIASQTNRHMHSLTQTKEIWLSLVTDLYHRNFIDLAPNERLADLTSNELVNLAKRVAQGPSTWNSDVCKPKILRQIILNHDYPVRPSNIFGPNRREKPASLILPRGEYLLLGRDNFECRNISKNEIIWRFEPEPQWMFHTVPALTAELIEDGHAVTIAFWISKYDVGTSFEQNIVRVIRLEFATKSITILQSKELPPTPSILAGEVRRLRINGDFVVAEKDDFGSHVLVIFKISTGSRSIVEIPATQL
ncbi:hypothetical protein DXG01_009714 [Tephrocybe rancida]|nr:hypothetical protein DXG01_009714 [Tephrocybe rancida]